jgi:hypothetical protein
VSCSLQVNQVLLSIYKPLWKLIGIRPCMTLQKNRESKKMSLRQYNYDKFIWIVGLLLLRGLKSPERHLWKVRFPWRYINCKIHFSNITQQPHRTSPICKATSNKCHLLRSRLSHVIERYFITWRRRIKYNIIQVYLEASSGHRTAESSIS